MKNKVKTKSKFKPRFSYQLLCTLNQVTELKSFKTLDELRTFGNVYDLPVEKVIAYRINESTGKKTALTKSKYAYGNKVYDLSKSCDGFYTQYSWTKQSPFEQETYPLPESFLEEQKEHVVNIQAPLKKSLWQKILDFFKKSK